MSGDPKADRLERRKTISEIVSNWFTVGGIIVAVFTYHQWVVERGDHAVEFLFKLDEQFNSKDVEMGRNLIDWDEQYDTIKARLEEISRHQNLVDEEVERTAMTKLKEQNPDDPKVIAWEKTESIREIADKKIQKVDALLQFYVTLNAVREQRQAPDEWLRSRYSVWLGYYNEDDRAEFKDYIDHYYHSLANWLAEDAKACPRDKYFAGHNW